MSWVAVRARMASRAAPTTRAGNEAGLGLGSERGLAVLGPAQGREAGVDERVDISRPA